MSKSFIYGILTFLGAVLTWYYNIQFIQTAPLDSSPFLFVNQLFVNHATSSISVDIAIACTTFWFWSFHETKRLKMTTPWWPFLVTSLGISFAFAFPLFLLFRERHLLKNSGHS